LFDLGLIADVGHYECHWVTILETEIEWLPDGGTIWGLKCCIGSRLFALLNLKIYGIARTVSPNRRCDAYVRSVPEAAGNTCRKQHLSPDIYSLFGYLIFPQHIGFTGLGPCLRT
jgi:hypothetical protein